MSSSSDADLIASLNNISTQITRYFGIFIFLFGLIGNLLNTIVLSQRHLRSNPCAWLFLVSSIAYLISIVSGLFPRLLATWDGDLTNTNQALCKLRIFIYFTSATTAFWLVMLATIDRWFSSNRDVHRRQRSTLKNAQRGAICILIISALIEIQQIFCYAANLINTPLKCYSQTVTCGIASDMCFALITVILPLSVMFIFGLMIISNVRQIQARLHPTAMPITNSVGHPTNTASNNQQNRQKKTDRQLLIMLFVQVLIILAFSMPFAISKLYSTLTRNTPKSALRITIENFLFNLFLLFLCISFGMPFYINTLAGGSVFRKTLFDLVATLRRKMMCRVN